MWMNNAEPLSEFREIDIVWEFDCGNSAADGVKHCAHGKKLKFRAASGKPAPTHVSGSQVSELCLCSCGKSVVKRQRLCLRAIACMRRLASAYMGDQTRQTPILLQWRRPRALRGVKGHFASFPSTEASRNFAAVRLWWCCASTGPNTPDFFSTLFLKECYFVWESQQHKSEDWAHCGKKTKQAAIANQSLGNL